MRIQSRSADALRPEYPDCEGTFLRQLAGLPAQGCSTDHLPAQPVADRTVALLSIDDPRMWNQPITAARPRRNWREPLSAPHFPFHPTHGLGRSTDCTTGARYTKSTEITTSARPKRQSSLWEPNARLDRIVSLDGWKSPTRWTDRCRRLAREMPWLGSQPIPSTTSIYCQRQTQPDRAEGSKPARTDKKGN